MRVLGVIVAAAALAILALGFWAANANPDADLVLPPLDPTRTRPQGGVYVGPITDPPHLNPFTTSDAVARTMVLRYTHDALLELDAERGELRSAVADVDLDASGLALDVRLRPGVVFAGGVALGVDDCEFAYRAATSPGVTLGSIGSAMLAIRAFERIDASRFRLLLKERHFAARGEIGVAFPIVQARWWREQIAILARAAGEPTPEPGDPAFATFLQRVELPGPGTGAYQLGVDRRTGGVAWRRGIELFLVQNPSSWRRVAQPLCWNLQVLHLRVLPDPATRIAELRGGRLDWLVDEAVDGLYASDAGVRERFQLLHYTFPALAHHMVVWNVRRPPFDDARVRRALGALFDRSAIVEHMLHGEGSVAAAWFRPGDPEYPDPPPPVAFAPELARAALLDAGVITADGALRPVEILVANASSLQRQILERAVPAFAQAGLRLEIAQREWGELTARRRTRDFDGVLMQWSHDRWIDPYFNFHSSEATENGVNYSGIADPQLDDLLARARVELDDAARLALYRQFNDRLRELEPVTLLVHPRRSLLVNRQFQGVAVTALGVRPDAFWVEAR